MGCTTQIPYNLGFVDSTNPFSRNVKIHPVSPKAGRAREVIIDDAQPVSVGLFARWKVDRLDPVSEQGCNGPPEIPRTWPDVVWYF